jgi:hypothetical protein
VGQRKNLEQKESKERVRGEGRNGEISKAAPKRYGLEVAGEGAVEFEMKGVQGGWGSNIRELEEGMRNCVGLCV